MAFGLPFRSVLDYPLGKTTPSGGVVATLIYDTFTGANNTPINGRTPDITTGGATWTVVSGFADIQSNRYHPSSASTTLSQINAGSANVTVSAILNLAGAGYGPGVIGRYQDSTHFWVAYLTTANINLYEFNGGVTLRGSYAGTFGATTDYTIGLVMAGNSISVTLGGVQVIAPYTSSLFNTATLHGLYTDAFMQCRADDFTVTAP